MRISELDPTNFPNKGHEFPASFEGETVRIRIEQIKALLALASEDISFRGATVQDALATLIDVPDDSGELEQAFAAIDQALAGKLATTDKASAAEVRAGSNDAKFVTSKAINDAMSFVTFTAGSINLANFINGKITLTATTTFAAPTNAKEGQTGVLAISQDGTGGRAASWNTFWDFGSAGVPTLSAGAGKTDLVTYVIMPGATKATCSFIAAA